MVRRDDLAVCDAGGIVIGWLVKLMVAAAVLGVIAFDTLSIGSSRVNIMDQGTVAAIEASENWRAQGNIQAAYDAALAAALEANKTNEIDTESFTVDPDGTVHLRISREAPTLVVSKFAQIRSWAMVRADASGRSGT